MVQLHARPLPVHSLKRASDEVTKPMGGKPALVWDLYRPAVRWNAGKLQENLYKQSSSQV